MKIVVCVKQVPGASSVKIDPETKRLVREGVASVTNPFDYHALELGVSLREQFGGELIALSMGPPKAEETLREAMAFGADTAVLLCDKRFAGSDTWSTSYALALAVKKIGGVDMVVCGKQAIDGDTAQVGPGIAAHLGWAQVSGVAAARVEDCHSVEIKRLMDDGHDLVRASLPLVVSTARELNEPRIPRLANWLRAVDAPIAVWNADDIGAAPAMLGLNGSPTRVVKTFPAVSTRGTPIMLDGANAVEAILGRLRLMGAV